MPVRKTDKLNVSALLRAIEIAGNMRNLSNQIGVSYQSILDWKSERRGPSPLNCLKIENVTEGKVKREEILPDYPWDKFSPEDKKDEKSDIAKNLLGMGMNKEAIAKATGLSVGEIEKLEE